MCVLGCMVHRPGFLYDAHVACSCQECGFLDPSDTTAKTALGVPNLNEKATLDISIVVPACDPRRSHLPKPSMKRTCTLHTRPSAASPELIGPTLMEEATSARAGGFGGM